MRQYAEQTKTRQSIFADKEEKGIFWNLDVPSVEEEMEKFDTLNFLYVYDSKTTVERDQQDWRVLDLMFFNTLEELEGGYATAFVYDCAWTGATQMDYKAFKTKYGCDKRPFQPNFSLWKTPDIKVNPYTGKRMPLVQVPFRTTEITQPRIKDWFTNSQPDYTQELISEEDAEQFQQEEGINKVYLFSTKKQTPPIY